MKYICNFLLGQIPVCSKISDSFIAQRFYSHTITHAILKYLHFRYCFLS